MKDLDGHKKICVLIDADNAQYSKVKSILEEISAHGHIVIKRAYGDWSSEYLKNWKQSLNELAIQPIQQFAYTTGKNSTDASMIIDAMDLLYSQKFDAFALVSSDSDFTKLASRLRESEIFVFGVGQMKTPIAFRNACDDFIYTENLDLATSEEDVFQKVPASNKQSELKKNEKESFLEQPYDNKLPAQTISAKKTSQKISTDNEMIDILKLVSPLKKAWEQFHDDEEWVNVAPVGSFLKRLNPDFDPRSYGVTKLPEVISLLEDHFEMKKYKGKGTVNIVAYKPKHIV